MVYTSACAWESFQCIGIAVCTLVVQHVSTFPDLSVAVWLVRKANQYLPLLQ